MKRTTINLIPDIRNDSPDYYCTWQTQLFATSDGKPERQRAIIGEKALFDFEKPYGWAYFYENIRNDLYLVMDDSWDVPPNGDPSYFGSLKLDAEKFPDATKGKASNTQAMTQLVDKIKAIGWKGLGGWVCAQESLHSRIEGENDEQYWIERLKEAQEAGISYWKVDWGKKANNAEFRKMLTALGHRYAPDLIIEHAILHKEIPSFDVFRTYDVPEIMSIPMTIEKICKMEGIGAPSDGCLALINCEDEAYVGAAGGFAIGVMRHPFAGSFPNGNADMSFPQVHRNVKTKMYEIIRAVRWHRVAPAFSFDSRHLDISSTMLSDTWRFVNQDEEIESWWLKQSVVRDCCQNKILTKSAPSALSRNIPLSNITVSPDGNGDIPYVVASQNPNGVFSIATLGRTRERSYNIPRCDISVRIGNADTVGVFGEYQTLALSLTESRAIHTVLMQDIAADMAVDVTQSISISDGKIIIPGQLIHEVGTSAQPTSDTSEPGVVIQLLS